VTLTANLFGGGTLSKVINIDGIHDGPGRVTAFHTGNIGWTNLVSVVFDVTAGSAELGFSLYNIVVNDAQVPEPATLALLGLLAGLGWSRRKM
jgi:hypothetical protein